IRLPGAGTERLSQRHAGQPGDERDGEATYRERDPRAGRIFFPPAWAHHETLAKQMIVDALRSSPVPVRALLRLRKPRVASLIVFTAIIGMVLATSGLPPAGPLLFGAMGIALVATSAAALNCVIEQKLDAVMTRTRARPLPRGEVSTPQALAFIGCTGVTG